ncbi:SusC/RagA family TonB-linked outer membrane protein [Flavobacterium litorale]|uniref:TonB-dependent receptor n=1 Tax=Flavobacterium litorale TaxID=2856519 RepID=A0ABX8VBV8_9FLAO|nr:TonB-dependent receptor [Flavobacterium litorale]QYJ68668.1 TonB-dependent receptor [Flavobacterium litorale]
MKKMYQKFLLLLLMLPLSALAQSTVTGNVSDSATGQPIPGVNIIIEGTTTGSSTDIDGNYTLTGVTEGSRIVFSFIGFANQTIDYTGQSTIDVVMQEDATLLEEVVVIGYGTTTKKDATGSLTTVKADDFNKGAITTADQLLTGRAPGIRITSNGGQPDAAPNIRIRGGSSLSAQNNPLIVIDGVPLDFVNPAGVNNPLSLVNPSDIESFTILKDASATAIYGSRASNGVIIITTKKGSSGAPQFNYNGSVGFNRADDVIDVMNGSEFTRFIQEYHPGFTNLLGVDDPTTDAVDNPATPEIEGRILYDTDWQDEVLRTSVFTDHNFSARGNLFGKVPARASIGYTKTEGIVKTDDYERYSASVKFTPMFLDDHLKVDVNARGLWVEKNNIDQKSVLEGALNMDPTKPVFSDDPNSSFGGYYQNTVTRDGNTLLDGQYNPVNLLDGRRRPEQVNKLIGNAMFDYKMHFLPELRAIVNVGVEASRANILEEFGPNALASSRFVEGTGIVFNPGVNYRETQHITNKTFDAYLAYTKNLEGPITRIDAQAGHAYQSFVNDGYKSIYQYNVNTGLREELINEQNPNNRYYNKMVLESFFGRANIDLYDKYLFTFTLRADGSSLFREDERWGYFPAAAFAWRITDESFMQNASFVNNLKLRLGYGITGQQDITQIKNAGYYPSTALFTPGDPNSQYLPGVATYGAKPFNDRLKWETTTTYNLGVDFSFFNKNLLSGSVDVYRRITNDLLVLSLVPPGQYLTNEITQNVGSLENRGIEIDLTLRPITTTDFSWEVLGNLSYNFGEIKSLNNVSTISADESSLPGSTGVRLARHNVGSQPYSAWVYEQLYDSDGRIIPGAFRDRNEDGIINDDDRYFEAIRPNWTFGFGTNITYKNLDFSANFHGQLDGKVYNAVNLVGGNLERALPDNNNSLSNVLDFYSGAADPRIETILDPVPLSDYYLEDAAFLRCDNITIGYRFNQLVKSASLRLYATVNNAFIITEYSGQDPENFNGIDTNFYPRPRTYSFGVNLDF